jgi:hypothetical protein
MYPSDSYYAKYSPQDSNVDGSIYVRAVPPTSSSHQLRTVYGLCASDMIQSMDLDGYISSRVLARVPGHEITSHEWDAHRPYVRAAPGVTEVGYARARSSAGAVDVRTCTRPRRLQLARPRTHRHHVYSHFSPRHTCNSAVRYVETATLRGQVYGPSLL